MSSVVREQYRPQVMEADTSFPCGGRQLGGFLASVSGTITITRDRDGIVMVPVTPVTAGVMTPLPLIFDGPFTVTLAGGAAGTLLV